MSNIKKKFLLYFFITIFFNCIFVKAFSYNSFNEIKAAGCLKVYTSADYYPLSYQENNELFGIEVDIAKKIAQNLNLQLEIKNVSFNAILLELASGKCDFAIASMSSNEEKAKVADFSVPYLKSNQVIITKKDGGIKVKADLNFKKLGVQSGSSGYNFCIENFKNSKVFPYSKPTEAIIDLVNGQIDAVILNDLPAEKLIANYKEVKIINDILFQEDYKIAVAKGNLELLNIIQKEIETLKASGEIQKIVENYKYMATEKHSEFFNNLIYKERYKTILKGLSITFQISIVSLIIGILIGLFLCYIKIYPNQSILFFILKKIVDGYISVIRGTPLLIQLFFMYYLILSPLGINAVFVSILVFGLNSGAYVTEIIRAGFSSVDKGQSEAGLSLGMNYNLTIRKILLPQAFKNIIPSLCNEFISLVKETSIVGFIGVVDLSKSNELIRDQTYQPLVPILTSAILYFCISSLIVIIMRKLERNLSYGSNRS